MFERKREMEYSKKVTRAAMGDIRKQKRDKTLENKTRYGNELIDVSDLYSSGKK